MSSQQIEGLWFRLRLEFLKLAEGGTIKWDRTSGGKPGTKAPPQAGEDLRMLDARWAGAYAARAKRAVLNDALTILRAHLLPNADIRKRRGTKEWRKAIADDPRGDTIAGQRALGKMYGTSERTVRRCRAEFRNGHVASESPGMVTNLSRGSMSANGRRQGSTTFNPHATNRFLLEIQRDEIWGAAGSEMQVSHPGLGSWSWSEVRR